MPGPPLPSASYGDGVPEHGPPLHMGAVWARSPPVPLSTGLARPLLGTPSSHTKRPGVSGPVRVRAEPEGTLQWVCLLTCGLAAPPAWCLRNEGVSSVLLGASSTDQLMENIGAIQVSRVPAGRQPPRALEQRSGVLDGTPICPAHIWGALTACQALSSVPGLHQ